MEKKQANNPETASFEDKKPETEASSEGKVQKAPANGSEAVGGIQPQELVLEKGLDREIPSMDVADID